jgi:tetratricopeptide (TPR) repeat protein
MHDPCFEATMAEIRGLDLGDDAELLAYLDARVPQGLSADEQLLRGVLLHRAGRPDEAVSCFDQAMQHGAGRSHALYLKSCVLREADRMGEALEALEEAQAAAAVDGLVSVADLVHAGGLLDWCVGNHVDALAALERALALDDTSAARWLHCGQLLVELGRLDEAARAFDRALLEEQDLDLAMVERAALEARRGRADVAADWLTKAIRLEPGHRRRAAEDPRFAPLREHAAFRELLPRVHAPAELAWLDDLAPWMSALRRDPELEPLGLEWLGEAESERILRDLLAEHERGPLGTMHTDATLRRSRELLATRRAVARGPGSRTRERVEEPCLLFVDALRPQDGVWLALSASYPPFLWLRVEPRARGLRRALAESFPRPRAAPAAASGPDARGPSSGARGPRRVDMPHRVRGFLGYRSRFFVPSAYTGGLEPATLLELDRHFSINPFVESATWGSAYEDDPWPDEIPAQPGLTLKLAERQAQVAQQARGHVWSLTRRTRHSRSYLTIEVHHGDLFVAEVRYQPSPHVGVIEAMNAHFGCEYPTDLPVDAVAALLGFQFDGAADLEAGLVPTRDPEQLSALLYVLSALRHDDPGALPIWRRHLEHPAIEVRGSIVDVAIAYNYEVLLEEMSLREPDPALRAEVDALLDEGIPMSEEDPWDDVGVDETVELEDVDMLEDPGTEELDDGDLVAEDELGRRGGARR